MFSLNTGGTAKKKAKKEDPRAKEPLDKKGKKQARHFTKGVTRFLRYNRDLLPEKVYNKIVGLRDDFDQSIDEPKLVRKDFEVKAEEISKVCRKAIPESKPSLLKENIEVLFVAVVIAMGIRAYFVQQFKIPTGSMQPTLNGIIAYQAPEAASPGHPYRTDLNYEKPNPVQALVDKIWFGRSHIEWRAKEDGDAYLARDLDSKSIAILFPRATLETKKGHHYSAPGTRDKFSDLLVNSGKTLRKGDLIARGYIETGDMLIVNKMAYHWKRPKRGEVFVFNTRGIRGIENDIRFNPAYGSQHYIKRLCGLPGDEIVVDQPNLIVNGSPATEPGIRRVMAGEGLYDGYKGYKEFKLGPHEYLALGDNSAHSSDSRSWGHVPEKNIVGKALFVFYPFGNHFGPIK